MRRRSNSLTTPQLELTPMELCHLMMAGNLPCACFLTSCMASGLAHCMKGALQRLACTTSYMYHESSYDVAFQVGLQRWGAECCAAKSAAALGSLASPVRQHLTAHP